MAYVDLIEQGASDETEAIFEREEASWGFLPNYAQALAIRPDVYHAWRALIGAVQSTMDPRRYELATVAAAKRLRSSYCTAAHSLKLEQKFYPALRVRDILLDRDDAGLEAVDLAIMDLAEKVASDASSVTEDDVQALRNHGLEDPEIADVVFAAAARSFFTKALDGLGVQADAELGARLSPEIRPIVEVGRTIEA